MACIIIIGSSRWRRRLLPLLAARTAAVGLPGRHRSLLALGIRAAVPEMAGDTRRSALVGQAVDILVEQLQLGRERRMHEWAIAAVVGSPEEVLHCTPCHRSVGSQVEMGLVPAVVADMMLAGCQ